MRCRLHRGTPRALAGPGIQLICPHCLYNDPGPKGVDPDAFGVLHVPPPSTAEGKPLPLP